MISDANWRILYYIGIIPLLTLPFFIKQFPESLSYYLARNRIGDVVRILNQVDPAGEYKESDDYMQKDTQEGIKGSPVKNCLTRIVHSAQPPYGQPFSAR